MALSYSYIQMQTQIIDELGDRADLLAPLLTAASASSPIKRAIQSAIAKWEREPFYFNEIIDLPLFTTVSGQELYSILAAPGIASTPYITALHVLISGNRYPLIVRTWQYLEEVASSPTATGQPTDWATFGEQIRLYPIPNGAYPVRASRTTRFAALSADADSNQWTSDAFDLIRCEAIATLARGILHDPELAAVKEREILGPRGYLYALKAESTRRAKGKIRPTSF